MRESETVMWTETEIALGKVKDKKNRRVNSHTQGREGRERRENMKIMAECEKTKRKKKRRVYKK